MRLTVEGDQLAERLSFEQLHRQEGLPGVLAELVYGTDVRVLERGCRARLTLEAAERRRVPGKLLREEFQGYLTPQLDVLGTVDRTHATGVDAAQNPVMRDRLAHEGKRHGVETTVHCGLQVAGGAFVACQQYLYCPPQFRVA